MNVTTQGVITGIMVDHGGALLRVKINGVASPVDMPVSTQAIGQFALYIGAPVTITLDLG